MQSHKYQIMITVKCEEISVEFSVNPKQNSIGFMPTRGMGWSDGEEELKELTVKNVVYNRQDDVLRIVFEEINITVKNPTLPLSPLAELANLI